MNCKNLAILALAATCLSAHAQTKESYGRNTLAISPLQVSAPGVGFGLSYEIDLDKEGIVALYLPATLTFSSSNRYNYYYYYGNAPKYHTGYFMPGIKFYPTGSKGKVKYAIAPTLAFVLGQRPMQYAVPLIYPPPYEPGYAMQTRFSFGTMILNSLNINATTHLHLGLEMGIGVSYLDQTNGVNTGRMPALFQFGAKAGYRF